MKMDRQEPFAGHRLQVAVQTVDHDEPRIVVFGFGARGMRELSGGHLGRINLSQAEAALFNMRPEIESEARAAFHKRGYAFIEQEQRSVLVSGRRRGGIL